jgi:hypothetical protein
MTRVSSIQEKTMSETKSFQGGCHCKAVRFEVELALGKVTDCNCSICSRVGALRAFAPASSFKLLSGQDALSDYQFGKKHLHHHFCKVCGVHPFARGVAPNGMEMHAINARCLDGVDVNILEVSHYDGAKL